MMAPATIGTPFNSDRRQMPILVAAGRSVMESLLALPRNEERELRRKPIAAGKVPCTACLSAFSVRAFVAPMANLYCPISPTGVSRP